MVENSSDGGAAPEINREAVAGVIDAGLKEIGIRAPGAKMTGQVPGNLIIFLSDGSTLVLTLSAAGAVPNGKPDALGNPGYDVTWQLSTIFVPNRG